MENQDQEHRVSGRVEEQGKILVVGVVGQQLLYYQISLRGGYREVLHTSVCIRLDEQLDR
jgi:hypothetical protein